jgi:hydroxypyruvate isomerase
VPRLAANLTMLWQDLEPFPRFEAAASVGFTHVEMLFPHQLDADRLASILDRLELEMVLFDPAAGDWEGGERGLLALPGREEEFVDTVHAAIALATRIGTSRLNALVGVPPAQVSRDQARETAIANLNRVEPLVRAAGITLLVEAINNIDMPGYWANTVEAAADLVQTVNSQNVRLQLDQYHAAMAGESALDCLQRYFALIRHVQIADVPGRHEPGTGTQPIGAFLDELDRLGYDGFVGLEYQPKVDTASSLAWIRRMNLRT